MTDKDREPGMMNMLTFDVEEWFHANYDTMDPGRYRGQGSHFRFQMDTLLQLCRESDCRATFFVLGSIGEDYPDIVQAIVREGHEVASHGYGHELAYRQSPAEFRADVQKSVAILEDVTGRAIIGYRAPSWSVVADNLHFLEILESIGLRYDASIFPVKTFLYGIPDAPTVIHRPVVGGRELDLLEVPMSVTDLLGRRIGYSGGFYFRFFPAWFIKMVIGARNKQSQNTILYLHPREIDATEQKLDLPWKEAFIHYYHIEGTKAKLADMMKQFRFTSISDYLRRFREDAYERYTAEPHQAGQQGQDCTEAAPAQR